MPIKSIRSLYQPRPCFDPAAGGGAATTWNQFDKASNAVLSGGDLTLTNNAGSPRACARSMASLAANQKCYYEIVINTLGFSILVGFANSSESLTAFTGTSSPTNAGATSEGGTYFDTDSANAGFTTLPSAAIAGDTICVALDSSVNKIWFRKNNGIWNNSAPADPATNTGGLDFTIQAGSVFAIGDAGDNSDSLTAKFASASWTFTAPSGFTQLA